MAASARMSVGGMLRMLGLAAIWGTSFLWMKLALPAFSPATIVVLRCGLGALTLVAVLAARRVRLPRDRALWAHLTVVALLGMSIPYMLFAFAEHTASTGLVGALNSTTPLFTFAFGLLFLRDRTVVNPTRIVGLVLGFAGAVVMLRPWSGGASVIGALLCLVAAACYGITFTYQARHLSGKLPPTVLAAVQLIAATPLAALAIPVAGPNHRPGLVPLLAITALGVACTGIAQILNYQLIASDGPVVASSVTYLVPVFALVFGWLFLHETVAWTTVVGAAVALAGVALTRA